MDPLRTVFLAYAAYGVRRPSAGGPAPPPADIDGPRFAKLAREAGLLTGGRLTAADVDLVFSKADGEERGITTAARRRLTFDDFVAALAALADRAGLPPSVLTARVAAVGAPRASGDVTAQEYVRFFDDKTTYTGVHARGGPTTVDGRKDLRELCDRSPADVRGVSGSFGRAR